jgi:diguanylate cyclase (GGDEF)-like protein
MALAQARREVRPLAVLSLDLDQFKQVNDQAGHAAGDQALQEVARRLVGRLREVDTVARVGGDEFVILIPGGNRDAAATVASAIQSCMRPAFACGGQSFHIGASIGISLYPENADDPLVLLDLADQAMYRAKANGQGCSEFAVAADLPVGA